MFFVMFPSGACDLSAAERALRAARFTVVNSGGRLTVSQPGSQHFSVVLSTEEWVALESAEIGERRGEPALAACNARFEVSVDDLDAALDEVNTLMELEGTLQDASQGYLFLTWNSNLLPPQQG